MRNQVSVLGSDGGSGNLGCVSGITRLAGVRQTIFSTADGSHQSRNGAESRGSAGPSPPIGNCLAISWTRESLRRELLVEQDVEENDLAGNVFGPEPLELFKVINNHDLGLQAIRGRGSASAQRR